jgi:hypothetical protein
MRKNLVFELPEIRLSEKQKLILSVLIDEFHGNAFGPQLLDESENAEVKRLSINEITYAFGKLVEMALVNKVKKTYRGRTLNLYSTSEFINNDAVIIK